MDWILNHTYHKIKKKWMNEWINKSIKQIKSLHQLFILENKLKKKKQTIVLYKTNLNFTIEQNDE